MYALNTEKNETNKPQESRPRYSLKTADYEHCHPYIYWWVKTVLAPLCRSTIHVDDYRIYRAFKTSGFQHDLVQKSLSGFIRTHGQIIQSWCLRALSGPCPTMTPDHIKEAVHVSLNAALPSNTSSIEH